MSVPKAAAPDFVIKYEPPENYEAPARPRTAEEGAREELVHGSEADAVETVQRLIEQGRTTPGRVRIYAHAQAIIQTSVTFPPMRPR